MSLALFVSLFSFCVHFVAGETVISDQKISCRPGQAISDIWWSEEKRSYKTFSIACQNFTDSCEEKCLWTVDCNIAQFGDGCYVRGINAMYDNMKDTQRILFLCCNTTSKSSQRHLGEGRTKRQTRTKEELNGKPKSDRSQMTVRQASSNYPTESPVTLYAETRRNEKANRLCPLHQMQTMVKVDPRLVGLAGLAGLSGLAGLALIKKKDGGEPPPPPPPCCCSAGGEACQVGCNECTPATLICNIGFCN